MGLPGTSGKAAVLLSHDSVGEVRHSRGGDDAVDGESPLPRPNAFKEPDPVSKRDGNQVDDDLAEKISAQALLHHARSHEHHILPGCGVGPARRRS